MAVPRDWKHNLHLPSSQGHQPEGRTIALHSLAVSPKHQRDGFGKTLVQFYTNKMSETKQADSIALLTYDRLAGYYEKLGFRLVGKRKATFAGVNWNDLVC